MLRRRRYPVAIALLLAALAAYASGAFASDPAPPGDSRRLVSMPSEAQQLLRQDMVDHLVVFNQLLAHLAAAEFEEASQLAEARLGKSSMGKHRGTGLGPGRFMPPEMHQLGRSMHESASEFATTVKEGDAPAAYAALQRVSSFCVACHVSFRVR